MKKCTCGSNGTHAHAIDGERYMLCGPCHAVVHIVKANPTGLNALLAVTMADSDEHGRTLFDRIASLPPDNKSIPEPGPELSVFASSPVSVENECSFILPLPTDFSQVRRVPPELLK